MSIAVALDDLAAEIATRGFAYLLTTADDSRPHAVALVPVVADGTLRFDAGRGTCANARARSAVTVVFPPTADDAFSLVIDGDATVDDSTVVVRPTSAIRHRPAPVNHA